MIDPAIVLNVSPPPSANRIWRFRPGQKPTLSPEYRQWKDKAGWLAKVQIVGIPPITGRFDVLIQVPISRRDTDNWVKPLLDLCQHIGAVTNDGNMHQVSVQPMDREDCLIVLTPRDDLGQVRAPAKKRYARRGGPPPKPTAARIRRTEAVRGRIPF